MPTHTKFDDEPIAAPAPQTPPSKRASPPSSAPAIAGPSSPKKHKPNGHTNGHGGVVSFHESDGDDGDDGNALRSPQFSKDGSVKKVNGIGKEEKAKRRRAEAARLLATRQELPIWHGKDAIVEAVSKNDTVVILGETGSGKTTQVPQFLWKQLNPFTSPSGATTATPSTSSSPRRNPKILITQPRRVAAVSLASRVAAEAGRILGQGVGYTVRFDDMSSEKTDMRFMTDGSLLAEMLGDRDLDGNGKGEGKGGADVIILDEAHERSLRTDMLMGFLKDVQRRRKKKWEEWWGRKEKTGEDEREPTLLKIVVMSATIDAKRFSEFFDNAPVLFVKGRQHKVKICYAETPQTDYIMSALKAIYMIHTVRQPGDVLVFLPGQEDIETVSANIELYAPDLAANYADKGQILVCPLYAKLADSEQKIAFQPAPPNMRKVILSTNIAETSVTIPGVKFVIDTGLAKGKQFHAQVGIDQLATESISQSSARQRSGRAGRESSGTCFRLYTEKDFNELQLTTIPEIQRVSLTFALLHLLASGQDSVWTFDFMDKPKKASMHAALETLKGLEAVDNDGRITPLGKQMSTLPLDPLHSRILFASFAEGCPKDIIDVISLLMFRDSLLNQAFKNRENASLAQEKFVHRSGDHMTFLNILKAYEDTIPTEQKNWCRDNYVNKRSLDQVIKTRRQLLERCERLGLDCSESKGEEAEPILGACLAGFFGHTALRQDDGTYRNILQKQTISIHPGSRMHSKRPAAIMYDELVLTTKTYARGVSAIEPSWLLSKAPAIFGQVQSGTSS